VAPQKSQQPGKSAAEFLVDLKENGRKLAKLFLKCVIHTKAANFFVGFFRNNFLGVGNIDFPGDLPAKKLRLGDFIH
jgi:hypothetical protein